MNKNEILKKRIIEFVNILSCFFPDLERKFPEICANKNDYKNLLFKNKKNLIIWQLNLRGAQIFNELLEEKLIFVRPTISPEQAIHMFEGLLHLPLAKQFRDYKHPHWVPVFIVNEERLKEFKRTFKIKGIKIKFKI